MKKELIFNNDNLNVKVRTVQNEDGSISINAEDAAIGLGWTQTDIKNGKTYTTIKWSRFNHYCKEFNFDHKCTKDDYIPESLFYLLGMKASNDKAKNFQKWIAIDVIPAIRKTGSYISNSNKEMEKIINDIVKKKIDEVEKKCSQLYRPSALVKYKISSYIKKRLGIKKANEEYQLVKERTLLKLRASKWEDVPVEKLLNSINLIDESINVMKLDRKFNQVSIFDM